MRFSFLRKHADFQELNRFLDGELEGLKLAWMEKHLSACSSCAQKLVQLRRVSQSVEGVESGADVSFLWPKIEESILQKKPVSLSWRDRFGVSFPALIARPALALSVVAFLILFTFFVFERRTLADNEAVINSITSENKLVMIFKTKERKITVIWLTDLPAVSAVQPSPAAK